MQVLFELDVNPGDPDKVVCRFLANAPRDPAACQFARDLLNGTMEHVEQIDGLIQTCAEHWDIDRMGRVDKCIMQIAIYEMLYCEDIPAAVSINEAIDIAKEFGSDDSGKFVNGILDRARKQLGLPPDKAADEGDGSDKEPAA